jgi:aminoglycoside 6'-N-acetyltransferase
MPPNRDQVEFDAAGPAEADWESGPHRPDPEDPAGIRLRPLAVADLPLLCRWIGRPHVHQWWHDSSEPAAVGAEYLPCIEGSEPSHPLIAELPAGPVGFLQWYRWADYPDYARRIGAGSDEAGFDYLIGEAALCGKGLGTRLIAALIDHILEQDPTVGGFVIDPEQANTASRRVLEKNGLLLVAMTETGDPEDPQAGPTAVYRLRLAAADPAESAAAPAESAVGPAESAPRPISGQPR